MFLTFQIPCLVLIILHFEVVRLGLESCVGALELVRPSCVQHYEAQMIWILAASRELLQLLDLECIVSASSRGEAC